MGGKWAGCMGGGEVGSTIGPLNTSSMIVLSSQLAEAAVQVLMEGQKSGGRS